MLDIKIIAIGKMKAGAERELCSRYIDRAKKSSKQVGLSGFNIIELAESQNRNIDERKSDEAKAILKNLPDGAISVVLDEKGQSINSKAFSNMIANWRDEGKDNICFIIGGADGLGKNLIKEANISIGFSSLTWPHQLVRIMLAEQLYRSITILSGHPYHKS